MIEGEPLSAETYEQAVTGAVAGRGIRRALEHAAGILKRGQHDAPDRRIPPHGR
jgi:hypothetical protein